ncbi:hypothetical protein BaRGS_00040548 [Batillaria attramentaria]|uniref:Uncharacterized protein n=1 Tax=Batillaria attramentaria TaxID=370345 RepID=A0ABD0IZQ4_9CAEN
MARNGHYVRMKRPTGPELYQDAARILEELLEKQLDRPRQSLGRPKRNITDPFTSASRPATTGVVFDEKAEFGINDAIERSKTMPSRPRPSRDEKLKENDLDNLRKVKGRDRSPSASSADTEGDGANVSENRQKKSLFRKAKDRLRHAFHRQEREHKMKDTVKGKDDRKESPKPEKPKKKTSPKNSSKDKKDKSSPKGSPQPMVDSRGLIPRSAESADKRRRHTLDSKTASPSIQTEDSGKRRNSASKLINSIRSSFHSGRRDRLNQAASDFHGDESKGLIYDKSSTPSPQRDEASSLPSQNGDWRNTLNPPAAPQHDKSPSPFPHSTSTDSPYGNDGKSSSIHSYISAHSGKNVLDDPGDDIAFMDEVDSVEDDVPDSLPVRGGFVAKGGQESLPNGHGPQNSGYSSGRDRKGKRPLLPQSSLDVDGDSDFEEPDGKQGTCVPLHERTEEEKEKMYGEIAKRLMEMGDNFVIHGGMSDSESQRDAASQLQADGGNPLEDLENEITEILREKGDEIDKKLGGAGPEVPQEVKEQIRAEMYGRFKQTVQHALGNEVSWNHLALLFYATKGVVSAVGQGTVYANNVKEMTLQYFSDKFATWIMDQGGFVSTHASLINS